MEVLFLIAKLVFCITVIVCCGAAMVMAIWLLIDTYRVRQWARQYKNNSNRKNNNNLHLNR